MAVMLKHNLRGLPPLGRQHNFRSNERRVFRSVAFSSWPSAARAFWDGATVERIEKY